MLQVLYHIAVLFPSFITSWRCHGNSNFLLRCWTSGSESHKVIYFRTSPPCCLVLFYQNPEGFINFDTHFLNFFSILYSLSNRDLEVMIKNHHVSKIHTFADNYLYEYTQEKRKRPEKSRTQLPNSIS